MLKLYNTLSRKTEAFKPINPPLVTMYTCGPTVYDYMHIGNLRTFVLSDILARVLKYNNYKTTSIQNITDIDDKIIKRAKENNMTIEKIAKQFTQYFIDDVNKLNIPWRMGQQPTATKYVDMMASYIKILLGKSLAYKEKDGSIYFDISKFPDYGKLSRIDTKGLKSGTRILSDEYSKDNIQDFALWKAVPKDEVGSFPSELGWGRPGWHIECSAMSQECLGNKIDIHIGGVDLIFPHHENEIAQSEGKTGEKPFVRYWVHGAHMLVEGKKMSKSLGNFYTLSDLLKKGFDPLTLRYLYLQTHYRQEMNFTWESLQAAQIAYKRLIDEVSKFTNPKIGCAEYEGKFLDAINDDLNMARALSVVWDLIKSDYPDSAKAESIFKMDQVLGLDLEKAKQKRKQIKIVVPAQIQKLIGEREQLRKRGSYTHADHIRNKIKKLGYNIKDTGKGAEVEKI